MLSPVLVDVNCGVSSNNLECRHNDSFRVILVLFFPVESSGSGLRILGLGADRLVGGLGFPNPKH